MPTVRQLHDWNVSYQEAVAIQEDLRKKVSFPLLGKEPRTIAGADVSFDKRKNRLYAAIVVLDISSLEPIEQAIVEGEAEFPYIPGLLSFREAPIVVRAYERLAVAPDALMCDGQGVAHPRGLGLASHLGLIFGIPTIGCAKSRLCGEHGDVGPDVGSSTPLKLKGRAVGSVLRTRSRVKPIYVSVGHMINLRNAVKLTLHCGAGYRIPEPTRGAHHLVTAARTGKPSSWPRKKR